MIKIIRKILGPLMSLFLIFGQAGDIFAAQLMMPNITREAISDIPETYALRGVSPTDSSSQSSTESWITESDVENLEAELEDYYAAKELEREMIGEMKAAAEKARLDKLTAAKEMEKELQGAAARKKEKPIKKAVEKFAETKTASEAEEAAPAKKYAFDPLNFMKGALGERIGIGHTALQEQRPGLTRSYNETDGFRLVRLFDWIEGIDTIDMIGVAARAEFVEQPFPTEKHILDAKKIHIIRTGQWNTRAQYRTQIMPSYVKAVGFDTYFTYGHLPKFVLSYEYRETEHEFESLYNFKDWDIQTLEFRIEDTRKWYPFGYVTLIPGYKYQIFDSDDARSGAFSSANEHRDVYFLEGLWAPSGTLEFYAKVDGHKTNFSDINWKYSPWHWGVRGEVRKKFLESRMSATLGYAHSFDKYSPFENFFRKEEAYLDVSKEFTGRLKGSSRLEFIFAQITEDDNMAPTYDTFNPYQAEAKVLNSKHKIQYELFKNFYTTGGLETSNGIGWNSFDNAGTYAEVEYYNPSVFRCNFGYKYTNYYWLNDYLHTLYFKVFFFM